jgi:ATP/maltotriose-dependent transcriptional regulator MalT
VENYQEALEAFRGGANARARELSHEALRAAEASGDTPGAVDALCMLARTELRDGHNDRVAALAEQARAMAREAGRPELERMRLHMLAAAARMHGDYALARRRYVESLELNEALGDERMVAVESRNLAYVEWHDGDVHRARTLFEDARQRARRLGYESLFPYILIDAALVASAGDHATKASRLFGSAEGALSALGQTPDPDDAAEMDQLKAHLIDVLGEHGFNAARTLGRETGVDQALEEVD